MRYVIISLFLVGCGIFTEKANSSVPIIFSGNSYQTNAPVQLTLNQPVEFVMTASMSSGALLYFVIQNAQAINQPASHSASVSFGSSISHSVNGSGSYQNILGWADGGWSSTSTTPKDSFFWFTLGRNVAAGDKIKFSTGTLGGIPTGTNFDVPSSGNYTTFLANPTGGARVSGFGATVPEPSALSLLAVGLGGLAMMRRRREQACRGVIDP